MAAIPLHQDPTLAEADRVLAETENAKPPRPYLGMSGIGEECERKLWYGFRWVLPVEFDANAHKRFLDGHRTEDLILQRLRRVPGIEVHTIDPETGYQFGVSDLGGHFKGHLDAAICGLIQAPKTWHVGEVKASEKIDDLRKVIAKLGEKNALREWNFTYYVQGVLYMHYTGMERHYLVCSSPGGRDWVSVRTNADPEEALRQRAKAERIVFSQHPLERLSDKPDFYKCRWCSFAEHCHGEAFPRSNCRTCLHSTPLPDGTWGCDRWNKTLSVEDQRKGCPAHLFIPALIPGEQVDANAEEEWVSYRLRNGQDWRDGAK